MTSPAAIVPAADPRAEMPAGPAARLDRIEAALASIGDEQRRFERLGFETPLARCHRERRYWEFLRAVFSIPAADAPRGLDPRGRP
jgi:hypothetical protein